MLLVMSAVHLVLCPRNTRVLLQFFLQLLFFIQLVFFGVFLFVLSP